MGGSWDQPGLHGKALPENQTDTIPTKVGGRREAWAVGEGCSRAWGVTVSPGVGVQDVAPLLSISLPEIGTGSSEVRAEMQWKWSE